MAIVPAYINKPFLTAPALVSVANANRDGTGTIVTVATAGSAGGRVDRLRIQALGTTTAGMVRLYESVDNGVTNRLIAEVPVTAVTPSGSVAAFTADVTTPIILPPNALLRASTNNGESFTVAVLEGGDF